MSVRLDPDQSVSQVEAALRSAALAAWGDEAADEVERAIPGAAAALWRIAQEPLGPTDVEP